MRARKATAVVGALVAAVVASGVFVQADRPGIVREATRSFRGIESVSAWLSVGDVADRRSEVDELPRGFAEEIALPVGGFDVRVEKRVGGGVVGVVVFGLADDAFAAMRQGLAEQGWIEAGEGQVAGGSFVKGSGVYRWLVVTCVQVGDATSVVVHYATTDERS